MENSYLNVASPTAFQPLREVLAAKRKLQKKWEVQILGLGFKLHEIRVNVVIKGTLKKLSLKPISKGF